MLRSVFFKILTIYQYEIATIKPLMLTVSASNDPTCFSTLGAYSISFKLLNFPAQRATGSVHNFCDFKLRLFFCRIQNFFLQI